MSNLVGVKINNTPMKTRLLTFIAFALIVLSAAAQEKKIQISGKVTDASQAPVPGVRIFADDQNTGQVTNKKGIYKVKVSTETKNLRVITSDGDIAEQPVNGKTTVDFAFSKVIAASAKTAKNDNKDEVSVGYGTSEKRNLTTQVSNVDTKKDKYVYKDIYEMLKGKPGVTVNGRSIRINQGPQSFSSGSTPLFVVDDVIVNSIDGIMPTTVKSIDILKGPSASIYGSRGANGVIVITLKK